MNDFNFYTPTEIVFGENSENEVAKLIKKHHGTKILVHYGSQSSKKSGLLDKVFKILEDNNITYFTLGDVLPNPRLKKVYEGIDLVKKEGIDFILAIGGGSVIDSAKAIGYGATCNGDVWECLINNEKNDNCLPVGTILTIAAAGSEMSDSFVITNENGLLKRGFGNEFSRCKFSILNPTFTYTLPTYQTFSGIVDIIMHTLERFFKNDNISNLTDDLAFSVIKNVMLNSYVLLKNPKDYMARSEIMWAGSLSHNGLTGSGYGKVGDWSCHQLEHELGAIYDVSHGAGLSAVWGAWARYVVMVNPSRFAKLGKNLFNIQTGDTEKDAISCINSMVQFFKDINMPTTISELGLKLDENDIKILAEKCSFQKTREIGGFKLLNYEDIIKIYKNSI